jgi:hypothetical protein
LIATVTKKIIERRRRAFFWTSKDSCHGSKWLVAWEQVCTSKLNGGLGLKNLELQNQCLLLKFVDKLFSGAICSVAGLVASK